MVDNISSIHRSQNEVGFSKYVMFHPYTSTNCCQWKRKTQREAGKFKTTTTKKHICYECWQQLYSLTHTISGQGTSHEHTKRPFIAFKGTLLSQSMESCLPGCVTGDQRFGFYTLWFDKALTQHQAECCWPSKQCPNLKLHGFYHISETIMLRMSVQDKFLHPSDITRQTV